ncbi:hypothetical protein VTL71DRAFT_10309 [Oculimacula yallundae]|uniref:2EXR domain-containing protein n=1 Tax=Oculimacula yallundae TaxID=86028 RepID=A0ABR4CSZ9_9HELO
MTERTDIDVRKELTPPTGYQAIPSASVGPHLSMPHVKLTSFTLFPRLPLELRNMIWEASISDPRIMVVAEHSQKRIPRLETKSRAAAVPSLLHTNVEARSVAVKKYIPFAARWGKPIYFDFNHDILRIESGTIHDLWGADGGRFLFPVDVRELQVKLRHLEITYTSSWGYYGFDTRPFQWMKSLKTLTIETLHGSGPPLHNEALDILASLAAHWLGPEKKLPKVTLVAVSGQLEKPFGGLAGGNSQGKDVNGWASGRKVHISVSEKKQPVLVKLILSIGNS